MIDKWSDGVADENMAEDILTDLAGLIRRHPWWHARSHLVLTLLRRLGVRPPARVLDAGCGWGVTLEALERNGYKVTGADISRRALERLDRPDRRLVEADLTQPPPPSELFDAVLALDVIEHVDDDRAAVTHLGSLTRPGGVVVVSVPALPDMYTEFDSIQGHRRRYLPETLRAAFDGSGLEIERVFWWGRWLVPMLRRQRHRKLAAAGESAAQAYRKYLRLPPWPAPLVFRLAFAIEQDRALACRLETGTSLYAVARRPAAPAGTARTKRTWYRPRKPR
ncbi:MAG TPA: class I SAM-dependent methyltransferase [Gemmataceae bacterium]|jgi:SAM-dependent methyltransferase